MNIPETYFTCRSQRLAECNSDAWLLYHKKSGARIFVLKNQDPNRVFTIGFRTPPADSTGLPHILEHSVLCGSKKFPVKDPFIELEKSSLQTFLNAMTYPDKTIYPVASCNEKDFRNLMDVYLDAVLHPSIYQEEKIFRQEGWHYEMTSPEDDLTINGVVYNEMKGAFSAPDEVLDRYCQLMLFPDTPYSFESGGDPEVIPDLSYETFLEFHRKYYHPSNSFIYLYGDLNVEEILDWMDREYLSRYEAKVISSGIPLQTPFEAPAESVVPYPIEEGEDPEGKAYLSQHWVVGDITDPVLYVAFQLLESALISMPGAPLKEALQTAGLGEEVYGGYQNGSRQPYFSIVAKNAEEGRREEFLQIVRDTLEKEVKEGIDRRTLEAALNILEFKNREADFGSYPKGLIYGIDCFDSWLYDADPDMHLRYEETFAWLRKQLDTGYFEELVEKYLLNNSHQAIITLHPVPGLTDQKEAALAEKLAKIKAGMSPEEIQETIRRTEELKAYQSEASSPEALATLPSLELSDIGRDAETLNNHVKEIAGIPLIHHEIFTSGILYLKFMFRADRIAEEDIPWLGLLRQTMSLLSTEKYSYSELAGETAFYTGGIGLTVTTYGNVQKPGEFAPYVEIGTRVLPDKLVQALELMKEILLHSQFTDTRRLKQLAAEIHSRTLTGLQNGGHSTAVLRATSYASRLSSFNDKIGGIDYYHFLEGLTERIEDEKGLLEIGEHLERLAKELFVQDGAIISLAAEEAALEPIREPLKAFLAEFPSGLDRRTAEVPADFDRTRPSRAPWKLALEKKNEGFRTSAQIQYVAVSGNFLKKGYPYHGSLRVLKKILGDEYLWINVRVKGGAYGCMCNFGRTGSGYFVSYRDPNLGKTLEIYQNIVPYLENFEVSERDMTGYVIGTIGGMDRPMNPQEAGSHSMTCYMSCVTQEMLQQEREEVLSCSEQNIRELAPYIQAVLECDQLCVVGNAGKIEEEKERFGHLESLN